MDIDMRYNADMKIPRLTARNESYSVHGHKLHFSMNKNSVWSELRINR
jgi:hypothetical protein